MGFVVKFKGSFPLDVPDALKDESLGNIQRK